MKISWGGGVFRDIDFEELQNSIKVWSREKKTNLERAITNGCVQLIKDGRSTPLIYDSSSCLGAINTLAKIFPDTQIYDYIIGVFTDHLKNEPKEMMITAYKEYYSRSLKRAIGDIPMGKRLREFYPTFGEELDDNDYNRSQAQINMRKIRETAGLEEINKTEVNESAQQDKIETARKLSRLKYPLRVLRDAGIIEQSDIDLNPENLDKLTFAFVIFQEEIDHLTTYKESTLLSYTSLLKSFSNYIGLSFDYDKALNIIKAGEIDISSILTPTYLLKLEELINPVEIETDNQNAVQKTISQKLEEYQNKTPKPEVAEQDTQNRNEIETLLSHTVKLKIEERFQIKMVARQLVRSGLIYPDLGLPKL